MGEGFPSESYGEVSVKQVSHTDKPNDKLLDSNKVIEHQMSLARLQNVPNHSV